MKAKSKTELLQAKVDPDIRQGLLKELEANGLCPVRQYAA